MSFVSRLKLGCAGVVVASLVAVAGTASAQEASETHLAAARDAISALGATDQFDGILPNAADELKASLIQATPDLQPQIDAAVDAKALELASRRGDLEREAASIYAKTFSEENLKAIADFYRSDAGKALLENGPLVTRELLKAAEIWSNGINRDLADTVSARLYEEVGERPRIEEPPAGQTQQ